MSAKKSVLCSTVTAQYHTVLYSRNTNTPAKCYYCSNGLVFYNFYPAPDSVALAL